MRRTLRISALALAVSIGWSLPARAQSADAEAVRQELAAMRAQMAAMAQRIDTLESQLAAAQSKADTAQAAADAAAKSVAVVTTAKPQTEITWDGAPKFTGKDGWSFKPRGRLQIDVGGVDAPRGIAPSNSLGYATEFRRAYIGFDGSMPGGLTYRAEIDIANNTAEITDFFLTYKATPELSLTVGHQKPAWGLDELTSDLLTPFMERAAFTSAFGFERRVGLSAAYTGKTLLVQGGIFTDNLRDLNDSNNSYSAHGRVVFMPRLGSAQLHLGGSAYVRDLNDLPHSTGYGARPFVHTTDIRLVSTGNIIPVTGERGLGLEGAFVSGRFHATAESHWLKVRRPGYADPTFTGGYAEVGLLLTDDETAYKGGIYERIRPKNPLGEGGLGALQVNARYDWLDLNDAGVTGGRQRIAGLSAIWIPTDYVRFLVNYGHIWIDDAALPAGTDRDYTVDVLGARAQFDF